jgi:iron complex outermembrane recepter protein
VVCLSCILVVGNVAHSQSPPEANASADSQGGKSGIGDLLNKDIEELGKISVVAPAMDMPVTSVTREASTVGRSAAAVFVITNEMIRRSGATSIPEALRMAPGLEVARVNSNSWAISSRGFNNGLADKLLVLMDGRTVYTPVYGGVYWDCVDTVLEDIDRIEVIRGPGGTLWGANAVNGVINIITKSAKDTQGVYAGLLSGTIEHSNESARYGGKIGENGHYRVYGKYFDRGSFPGQELAFVPPFSWKYVDRPGYDEWNQGRVGFRADWDADRDHSNGFTIQGDHYVGNSGGTNSFAFPVQYGNTYNTGQNVLARWKHVNNEDSDWTLQAYFDNFQRDTILNSERVKTSDIDFVYRFPLTDRQQITCGAGYRYIQDDLPTNDPNFGSFPTTRHYFVGSQFVQDEIEISPDKVQLILGCKLEQNSYTYFEYQPTIRAMYTPDRKHTFWGAVSRAVHTPTRIDQNMYIYSPYFGTTIGNPNEKSEALMAYELGYREQMTERFSWDLATFYNVYHDLRSTDEVIPFVLSQIGNGGDADTYGAELAINYTVSERWKLSGQYTCLLMYTYGNTSLQGDGHSPRNQFYVRSSWNVRENVDFDLMARYVDSLSYVDYFTGALSCGNYIETDARLAWRPRKNLELALVGQNLLNAVHYEFYPSSNVFTQLNEVPRSVYGSLTWRY